MAFRIVPGRTFHNLGQLVRISLLLLAHQARWERGLTYVLIAGCKAALVPIEVTSSSVTYDTSSYSDLAAAAEIVVQECVSNTTSSGGWELAGRSSFPSPSFKL